MKLTLIDKAFLLKKTTLFGSLDLDLLLTLSDKMEQRSYSAEGVIFKEGQEANQLYLIVSGEVKIEESCLGPSDFFGDESIFNEKPRGYSAHCSEPTTLLTLTRTHLLNIIAQCPSVAIALLKKYTENGGFRRHIPRIGRAKSSITS